MKYACAVLYCNLWPFRLYHVFTHYLIKYTIVEKKKFSAQNFGYDFLPIISSAIFLILRRIRRGIVINAHRYSCKVPVMLIRLA